MNVLQQKAAEEARARAEALLDGRGDPADRSHLPEDRIERLKHLRDETERQLLAITQQGKGQAVAAMMVTLEKHEARLQRALEERERNAQADDPAAHREAILAYVRELDDDDPLRVELRALLCRKAK